MASRIKATEALIAATRRVSSSQSIRHVNPFCLDQTSLPWQVLLMVKIIVIAFIWQGHVEGFPPIYLPHWSALDALANVVPPDIIVRVMQGVFYGATVLLLFNRYVRSCCLILGGIIFFELLASVPYYSNSKTYCAFLLILSGLQHGHSSIWLLRMQVVIVYFGAGLDKLLTADWRSGVYMDYWLREIIHFPLYIRWSTNLAEVSLAQVLSWATIIIELVLVPGFLVRRLYVPALILGILFHLTSAWVTGSLFGLFVIAMWASYLVFIKPANPSSA